MELDIVAYRDKTLVVVEVKTRKTTNFYARKKPLRSAR